jgi:hypothetical protein
MSPGVLPDGSSEQFVLLGYRVAHCRVTTRCNSNYHGCGHRTVYQNREHSLAHDCLFTGNPPATENVNVSTNTKNGHNRRNRRGAGPRHSALPHEAAGSACTPYSRVPMQQAEGSSVSRHQQLERQKAYVRPMHAGRSPEIGAAKRAEGISSACRRDKRVATHKKRWPRTTHPDNSQIP